MKKQAVLLVFSLSLLCGCAGLFAPPKIDRTAFVLGTLEGGTPEIAPSRSGKRLIIEPVKAPAFIDSERILFSKDRKTIGFYQYSSWAQSPAKRFADLLAKRFENSGTFSSVAKGSGLIDGDYVLSIEIRDFFHDAEKSPGVVVVKGKAELIELGTSTIKATHQFSREEAATSFDAKGAVDAFNTAAASIVEELLNWVQREM